MKILLLLVVASVALGAVDCFPTEDVKELDKPGDIESCFIKVLQELVGCVSAKDPLTCVEGALTNLTQCISNEQKLGKVATDMLYRAFPTENRKELALPGDITSCLLKVLKEAVGCISAKDPISCLTGAFTDLMKCVSSEVKLGSKAVTEMLDRAFRAEDGKELAKTGDIASCLFKVVKEAVGCISDKDPMTCLFKVFTDFTQCISNNVTLGPKDATDMLDRYQTAELYSAGGVKDIFSCTLDALKNLTDCLGNDSSIKVCLSKAAVALTKCITEAPAQLAFGEGGFSCWVKALVKLMGCVTAQDADVKTCLGDFGSDIKACFTSKYAFANQESDNLDEDAKNVVLFFTEILMENTDLFHKLLHRQKITHCHLGAVLGYVECRLKKNNNSKACAKQLGLEFQDCDNEKEESDQSSDEFSDENESCDH